MPSLTARNHVGRHRAPSYSPLNELADIATRSAQPAMKVSAVAVASGGLVATFAMPASAAPAGEEAPAVAAGAAVATAPQIASQTVAVAAPPAAAEAVNALASVSALGFTAQAAAVAQAAPLSITKIAPPAPPPAPAAAPAPRAAAPAPAATTTRASRTTTTTRTAAPAAAPAPAPAPAKAPAPAAAPAPTGGIVGIAASLTGIPYVWGGTTTGGFDCSGYTGYVYKKAGKSIPRTAEEQRAASTKVSNPQPGDLIFFGYPAYHVGIYAGNGKLYEASKPGTTTGLHTIWSTNVSYGRF